MLPKSSVKAIKELAEEMLRLDTNVDKKYLIGSFRARVIKIITIIKEAEYLKIKNLGKEWEERK